MAETETIREKILKAIGVKLAGATIANGYVLDCGRKVGREVLQMDADDVGILPACAFAGGDETSEPLPRFEVCTMQLGVEGHVLIDDGDPSKLKEQIRGDLIRVMTERIKEDPEDPDVLSGLIENIRYSNSGNPTIKSNAESVGIQVVFEVTYKFKTGDPFSQ